VAVAKTGKLHGVLGQELEEARLLYLEKHENVSEEGTPSHENTHTHEEQKEKKPRGKHSKKDVMYGHSQTTKRFGMRANRRIMNKFELRLNCQIRRATWLRNYYPKQNRNLGGMKRTTCGFIIKAEQHCYRGR
jgi:hypothetical protein